MRNRKSRKNVFVIHRIFKGIFSLIRNISTAMMKNSKDDPSSEKRSKSYSNHVIHENQSETYPTWRPVVIPRDMPENSFLRLPQVLSLIPVSRSAWWAGCKSGRFPKPTKLGPRTSAWRTGDIIALMDQFAKKEAQEK